MMDTAVAGPGQNKRESTTVQANISNYLLLFNMENAIVSVF